MQLINNVLSTNKPKHFVLFFLVGILFFSACQNTPVNSQTKSQVTKSMKEIKSLKDFQWEKRIILVKEANEKGLKQLRKQTAEINERHIVWFRLSDKKLETNYDGKLPKDFAKKLETNYFEKLDSNAFLIGKDGGIKSKDKEFNLTNYFEQIDSMPMRQQEMREN